MYLPCVAAAAIAGAGAPDGRGDKCGTLCLHSWMALRMAVERLHALGIVVDADGWLYGWPSGWLYGWPYGWPCGLPCGWPYGYVNSAKPSADLGGSSAYSNRCLKTEEKKGSM